MKFLTRAFLFKFCISLFLSVCLAAGITFYERSVFYAQEKISMARFWCDGCFISAVLFIGCGILISISKDGGFYSTRYAFLSLSSRFSQKKIPTYAEYLKSKGKTFQEPPLHLLAAGLIMLTAAFILLIFS